MSNRRNKVIATLSKHQIVINVLNHEMAHVVTFKKEINEL
jgi:predicted SprT family Zn-dependent metalloprotease